MSDSIGALPTARSGALRAEPQGSRAKPPAANATCDSEDYRHTFYGILNKEGQFWTPLPFHDEETALAHLTKWAKGSYKSMLSTHKIVPVRIRLETVPAQPSAE